MPIQEWPTCKLCGRSLPMYYMIDDEYGKGHVCVICMGEAEQCDTCGALIEFGSLGPSEFDSKKLICAACALEEGEYNNG